MPPTDELSTFASEVDLSVSAIDLALEELNVFAGRGASRKASPAESTSPASLPARWFRGFQWSEGALGSVAIDQGTLVIRPKKTATRSMETFSSRLALPAARWQAARADRPRCAGWSGPRASRVRDRSGTEVPLRAIEGLTDGITETSGSVLFEEGDGLYSVVPRISIGIRDGRMAVSESRLVYSDLHLDAGFSPEGLEVEKLKVRADPWGTQVGFTETGYLNMSGTVGMTDGYALSDVNFTVRANNFWVADRKDLRLKMSTAKRIKIQGNFPARFAAAWPSRKESSPRRVGLLAREQSGARPAAGRPPKDEEFTQGGATSEVAADDPTKSST